jgi:hypothetical protein
MDMPTYQRRYFLSLDKGIKEEQAENTQENQNNVTYNGKGQRTRTMSGKSLINAFRTGQIPKT